MKEDLHQSDEFHLGHQLLARFFSHKKRDKALCPSWKPRLICQIQLQSIVIQLCGLKQFAQRWCSAADLVVPIPDREWFCFSNHMNRIQGYDGSAIFSVYEASRNGDARRLIRVPKTFHKPDVFKENCSLNQHFVDGTRQ